MLSVRSRQLKPDLAHFPVLMILVVAGLRVRGGWRADLRTKDGLVGRVPLVAVREPEAEHCGD
jgi:hypothetical protein